MIRKATFAMAALLGFAAAAQAAPIVTMTSSLLTVPGSATLDFFFSSSAGAEFTNYNLDVLTSTGNGIQDPTRSATTWYDQGGDAPDTWANTPSSLLFGSAPSSVFQTYKPTAPGQSAIPTNHLQWEIFDTEVGDGNDIDTGDTAAFPPDGHAHAPFHLARILVSPNAAGTAVVNAFDTLSGGAATRFSFDFGVIIPEPATLTLLGLAMVGMIGVIRRR
jgi:hypothetical protein